MNIPPRAVRTLHSAFGDQGYEFICQHEFAPATADDEFWASAFRRYGGHVIISADKNIAKRPYQILAFQENELICFFCDKKWSNYDMTSKCVHLITWWPRIQAQITQSSPRDCWWIPFGLRDMPFRRVDLRSR